MSGEGRGFGGRGEGGRGGRGRGERDGGRGRGRGGRGRGRGRREEEEWKPVTKLGKLINEQPNKDWIKSLETVFLHSLTVKETKIIDAFLGEDVIKEEVMKIMPVQKQTTAGQRTRFKAFVAVGDGRGHLGLGVKCAKEVATAIRGAIDFAKLAVVPIRRGYWGRNMGKPHTVPCKVTGTCGSVQIRLIPAPRGSGLVAAPASRKMLAMAGIDDCYSASTGHTRTLGNFVKATYYALKKTYTFLTPDLWSPTVFTKSPYQEFTDTLAKKGQDETEKAGNAFAN